MERWTDKMGRVQGNVRKMIEGGAGQPAIDEYLSMENVTPANMRQYGAVKESQASTQDRPNILERFGRGMTDIAMGAGQLAGGHEADIRRGLSYLPFGTAAGAESNVSDEALRAQEKRDVKNYEQAVGPGVDLARLGGQAAATAPLAFGAAAPVGLLARTAVGSGLGGLGGALVYADNLRDRIANTAGGLLFGGAFNAATPALAKGGGALYAKGKALAQGVQNLGRRLPRIADRIAKGIEDNIARSANDAGIPLSDLGDTYVARIEQQAKNALDQRQPFDYDAAVRQARAERFGFTDDVGMTRGQASRDPRVYSREVTLSKKPEGAELATRRIGQQAKAQDRIEAYPSVNPVELSETLSDATEQISNEMQAGVRAAYQKIRGGGEMSGDSLANRTAQIIDDFGDSIPSRVLARIQKFTGGDKFTGDDLIKLDKLVSKTMAYSPLEQPRNAAAAELKQAFMGVMEDAVDQAPSAELRQAYQAAKALAAERFQKLGPQSGLVARLAHGAERIDPTEVNNKIVNGKMRDLRRMKNLLPADKWENVKQLVLSHIRGASLPSGTFSQAKYNTVVKQIGESRLKLFFGDRMAKDMMDFGLVARDLFHFPAMHTINTSNTGPYVEGVMRDMAGSLLDVLPGGRIASGLLSKGGAAKAQRDEAIALAREAAGLLSAQPIMPPAINPITPYLPVVRGLSPAAGLLGNQYFGQ